MCVVSPFWGPSTPLAVDRKENAPSSIVWVEGHIARAPGLHGKIAKVSQFLWRVMDSLRYTFEG